MSKSKKSKLDDGTSSAPPVRGEIVFSSSKMLEIYDGDIKGRTITTERVFEPGPNDGCLLHMLKEKGWTQLAKRPDFPELRLVKEFYVAALFNRKHGRNKGADQIKVRKSSVAFGVADIRRYYELPDCDNSIYKEFLASLPDMDDLVAALCAPGTVWKGNEDDGSPSFPKSALSPYGKAWFYFICANLMPTQHYSTVCRPRALLLYAITHDIEFDAAEIIREHIIKSMEKHAGHGSLVMPCLIGGLCKEANVLMDPNAEPVKSSIPITTSTIKSYSLGDGGYWEPSGAGYLPPPPGWISSVATKTPITQSGVAMPSSQLAPSAGITDLAAELCAQRKELTQICAEIRQEHQHQAVFRAHMLQFTNTFYRRFPSDDPKLQFPPPLIHPQPPPEDDA